MLHLILTEGTIQVGDYFQAGGWGGKVKRVIFQTNNSNNDNNEVVSGMAVTIVPSYFDNLEEPRPSTEWIHFFSSSINASTAKEQAMLAQDEVTMTAAWENHQQSEEEVKRFRLRALFTLDRLSKNSYYFKKLLLQRKAEGSSSAKFTRTRQIRQMADIAADEAASASVSVKEEKQSTIKRVIIVRMKSELDLGTFIDALDDWHEQQEGDDIIRLLQTGVGDIAKADIDLALAAGDIAEVIGYNVNIDKHARALAKAKGVKVTLYDHMPQLLGTLFERKIEL